MTNKSHNITDLNADFLASTGWLRNFMLQNDLSLRRKTSIVKKDQYKFIDKLVSFALQARRLSLKYRYQIADIIAMDETPVLSDMISATTIIQLGIILLLLNQLVTINLVLLCVLRAKLIKQNCLQ